METGSSRPDSHAPQVYAAGQVTRGDPGSPISARGPGSSIPAGGRGASLLPGRLLELCGPQIPERMNPGGSGRARLSGAAQPPAALPPGFKPPARSPASPAPEGCAHAPHGETVPAPSFLAVTFRKGKVLAPCSQVLCLISLKHRTG